MGYPISRDYLATQFVNYDKLILQPRFKTLTDSADAKVPIKQTVADAGKLLVVGADGNVTLQATTDATTIGKEPINGTALQAAIGALDCAEVGGGARQYIASVKQVDGVLAATAATLPTTIDGYGITDAVYRKQLGAASTNALIGIATLNENGKVPSSQLPAYVDDVLEYQQKDNFPETGESGKIYLDIDKNLSYRWSGSTYVEISPSLALGETNSTAYSGEKGKLLTDAFNKHETNTIVHIKTAERDAWNNKVDKVTGKGLSTNDYTTAEKTKLAGIAEGANAYTHPNSGVTAGTYRSVTVNAAGHITAGSNPTTLAGYGITDAAAKSHTHNYAGASSPGGNATNANNAYKLSCTPSARPSSANLTADGSGSMITFKASSNMTKGAPSKGDGHILHFYWDNTSGWDNQLAVAHDGGVEYRCMNNGTWKDWVTLLDSNMVQTATAKTHTNHPSNQDYIPSMAFISHWNGAYNSSNNSNLAYCNKGAFGTMATQNAGDYVKTHIASFSGNGDSKEYCLVCTLKITGQYINHPIEITLQERGCSTIARLEILYNTTNNTDPTLNSFYVNGRSNDYYIYKSATSTWQIYAKKNESYSGIKVKRYIDYEGVSITWNMTNATLPTSGTTKASLMFATTDTTYSAATQSAQGLMSAADKTKLDGIATGANKTTVDSALSSSSTNPVANKAVNTALNAKANKANITGGTFYSTVVNTQGIVTGGDTGLTIPTTAPATVKAGSMWISA